MRLLHFEFMLHPRPRLGMQQGRVEALDVPVSRRGSLCSAHGAPVGEHLAAVAVGHRQWPQLSVASVSQPVLGVVEVPLPVELENEAALGLLVHRERSIRLPEMFPFRMK